MGIPKSSIGELTVKQKSAAKMSGATRTKKNSTIWIGQLLFGVILFSFWEICSGTLFNAFWVSKPSLIIVRLIQMFGDGTLWYHLSATLQEILLGLSVGMVSGIVLGIALAYSGVLQHWIFPYIMALYSLPKVSLAPLFVVWFGIGLISKVAMVVFMVLFAVFFNIYEGIRNIDPNLNDMMNSFKASPMKKLRWVIIPSIMVWILNGLRIAIGSATIGAVIAEMVGSSRGIGYYITYSSGILDTTGVFAGLFTIMLVAITLDRLVVLLEKYVLQYR